MKRVLADITNELRLSPVRKVPREVHLEEFSDFTSPDVRGLKGWDDQELLHRRLARLQLSPEPCGIDDDDPQGVAEYVADIFSKLEDDEIYHLSPQGVQLGRLWERERATAVDWMVEVQVLYGLRTETLFLAVSLLDSFLKLNEVNQVQLQLAVVCSLFVAAKFEEKRRQLRLERKKRGNAEQEAQELREQLSVLVKKAGAGGVLSAAGHLAMQGNGLTKEALKVSEKQEPATYCKHSPAAEVLQWKRLAAHREKLLQQEERIIEGNKITEAEYCGSEALQHFRRNQRTRAAMVREAYGSLKLGGFES